MWFLHCYWVQSSYQHLVLSKQHTVFVSLVPDHLLLLLPHSPDPVEVFLLLFVACGLPPLVSQMCSRAPCDSCPLILCPLLLVQHSLACTLVQSELCTGPSAPAGSLLLCRPVPVFKKKKKVKMSFNLVIIIRICIWMTKVWNVHYKNK